MWIKSSQNSISREANFRPNYTRTLMNKHRDTSSGWSPWSCSTPHIRCYTKQRASFLTIYRITYTHVRRSCIFSIDLCRERHLQCFSSPISLNQIVCCQTTSMSSSEMFVKVQSVSDVPRDSVDNSSICELLNVNTVDLQEASSVQIGVIPILAIAAHEMIPISFLYVCIVPCICIVVLFHSIADSS